MECQFSGGKVNGQGHRTSKNSTAIWRRAYLRPADRAPAAPAPTAWWVWPGISKSHAAHKTRRTAVYHVGADVFACLIYLGDLCVFNCFDAVRASGLIESDSCNIIVALGLIRITIIMACMLFYI